MNGKPDPTILKLRSALKLLGQAEALLVPRAKVQRGGDPFAAAKVLKDVTAARKHVVSALSYLGGPNQPGVPPGGGKPPG